MYLIRTYSTVITDLKKDIARLGSIKYVVLNYLKNIVHAYQGPWQTITNSVVDLLIQGILFTQLKVWH